MFVLIKKEMNDQGQEVFFTLYKSENADDIKRAWENTLDKVGLEIIKE